MSEHGPVCSSAWTRVPHRRNAPGWLYWCTEYTRPRTIKDITVFHTLRPLHSSGKARKRNTRTRQGDHPLGLNLAPPGGRPEHPQCCRQQVAPLHPDLILELPGTSRRHSSRSLGRPDPNGIPVVSVLLRPLGQTRLPTQTPTSHYRAITLCIRSQQPWLPPDLPDSHPPLAGVFLSRRSPLDGHH